MASEEENSVRGDEKVGLCVECRFARKQESTRHSIFYRCARSDDDDEEEDYPRYPGLPVLECRGYEASGAR